MNKIAAASKKFVTDHKVAITIVTTTAVVLAIERIGFKQHDDFLREHGLYEEFYAQND